MVHAPDGQRCGRRAGGVIEPKTETSSSRPEQKASKVEEVKHAGKRGAMVGDGVNDAPTHISTRPRNAFPRAFVRRLRGQ